MSEKSFPVLRIKIFNMVTRLVWKFKYRKLPAELSEEVRAIYSSALNGFDDVGKIPTVDGEALSKKITRVVIGDYGAYAEIEHEDLLTVLKKYTPELWRFDNVYLAERGLNIKYLSYSFKGKKIYYQLGTVTYADYQPGKYYVSVLDLD